MTTQADELRELIREANGVRGDLERERRRCEKLGGELVELARKEIEQGLLRDVGDMKRIIEDGLDEALKNVSEQVRELFETLIGVRPVPRPVAKNLGADEHPEYGRRPVYYPDLRAIAKNWDSLNAEQREMVRMLLRAAAGVGENSGTVVIPVNADIPADVRKAIRSFR